MRKIEWYFDFVSPFSYLALHRLGELPDVDIVYRPVLFAALLNHWGQKGPAEIPAKRLWTYRWCTWLAAQHKLPFRFPAVHPFNPLQHLRLVIAAGSTPQAVRAVFEAIWTRGSDPSDPAAFAALMKSLGVTEAALTSAETKNALRAQTEEAAAHNVFGVPTLRIDGELFWGLDAMDFAKGYLTEPALLRGEEMQRLSALPFGAVRKVG